MNERLVEEEAEVAFDTITGLLQKWEVDKTKTRKMRENNSLENTLKLGKGILELFWSNLSN